RGYLAGPFRWADVTTVGCYLLPLAAAGAFLWVREGSRWKKPDPKYWPIVVFLGLAVLSYARVQQKQARYLFDLTLPLAVLSAAALARLPGKAWRMAAAAGLAVLCAGSIGFAWRKNPGGIRLDDVRVYRRVMAELGPRLGDCRLGTNAWDFVNYFGRTAEPFPMDALVETRLAEGSRLLLFKNMGEPKLSRAFLGRLPILAETEAYILIGSEGACAPARPYVYRYLDLKKESMRKKGRRDFPDTLLKLLLYKDKGEQ
ncbi:MAG: hypothetical protein ABSA30_12360, partial [Candidatus Aminicenantales bacterium]